MKYIGWRSGIVLRSWGWCILIQCFMRLPYVFTDCNGVNISVELFPKGYISVRYGDPLELFCTTEFSSDDIEFLIRNKRVESEKINETTRRLYIDKPNKWNAYYQCRNLKNRKICTSRVLVGSAPANLTDFNCISKNLEVLKCSWTEDDSFVITRRNLTFSVNGYRVRPYCVPQTYGSDSAYCTWTTTSQPRYRNQAETLHFYMESCNHFGCNNQEFTIDHNSIVKLDPPSDLIVTNITSHSVALWWRIPNKMYHLLSCGIEHIIEYRIPSIDNATNFHRIDTSTLSARGFNYSFTLSNLSYANMQYEVRISIKTTKSVERKYWSDFNSKIFYTASEIPQRPPEMVAGAFDQEILKDYRSICVYWKQLAEYEHAGNSFTYKVSYTQGNTSFHHHHTSLSYVIIRNLSSEAVDVTVWSYNAEGLSHKSSHIHISLALDRDTLAPTIFCKLAYVNGTYELVWVGVENIDNYTLIWCLHDNTQICSSQIDFAVLDPKANNHVINLPREHRYKFAISANKGTRSSGMVWALCDRRTELMKLMSGVKVNGSISRTQSGLSTSMLLFIIVYYLLPQLGP